MFRKRVMLGVLAEALMKWMAASRSTANVCMIAKSSQHMFSPSHQLMSIVTVPSQEGLVPARRLLFRLPQHSRRHSQG